MPILETAVVTAHLVFAGLWTGSVVFVGIAVLPLIDHSDLGDQSVKTIVDRLVTTSRTSALVLFLTGGHMAATAFTFESLTASTRGRLVLVMLALWVVLAGLVEVGTREFRSDLGGASDTAVSDRSRRLLQGAAVVAGFLLLDAGLLAAG